MSTLILGIESSCDDTAAAVIEDGYIISNVISSQDVHKAYGGVVPELASRAHQQHIIPVVDQAIKRASIKKTDIDAVAFSRGPGLMGSLLVGTSFAKGFSLASKCHLIEVNHLQAHIHALFIKEKNKQNILPEFPFLCLLVSGGHSQLVVVNDHLDMQIIGQTIDDAAGEAFDKCAKIMGIPYPGGPLIDKYAKNGNREAFTFAKPNIDNLNYSFSGLKTSFLYFIRDRIKENPQFIKENRDDLCASIQATIIDVLMDKLVLAAEQEKIGRVALAGGVSANSGLQKVLYDTAKQKNWKVFIPKFEYTTDNAAMIAMTGYFKYQAKEFAAQDITPLSRMDY